MELISWSEYPILFLYISVKDFFGSRCEKLFRSILLSSNDLFCSISLCGLSFFVTPFFLGGGRVWFCKVVFGLNFSSGAFIQFFPAAIDILIDL